MLNKQEFKNIRKQIEQEDKIRENIIQTSREIITLSKRIIYSMHRGSIKEAKNYVKAIKTKKNYLDKINIPTDVNINKCAYQEYAEALAFYGFCTQKKIPTKKSLKISTSDYLMGLCDLTGELVRKVVSDVIHKDIDNALEVKKLVDEIYGEFLKFNLRNGELRKKSDAIKWNLKKIEDVIFEAKMKGMMD